MVERAGAPRASQASSRLENVLALGFGNACLALSLHALHDVRGIAALEGRDDAIVHLPHVEANLIEKPAIVRDEQKCTLVIAPACLEMLGQPVDALDVQVVGRLVHHEHIVIPDENASKVDATALSTRQRTDLRIPIEVAHEMLENRANTRVTRPFVFGTIANDGMAHRVVVI